MFPAPLTIPVRTSEQNKALCDAVAVAPGGKWMLEHLDDGPYWLATVTAPDDEMHWQVRPYLEAALQFDTFLEGVIECRVYLLTDLAFSTAVWYAGNGRDGEIYVDREASSGPYESVPTTADLAWHFANLFDDDYKHDIEQVLLSHQDQMTTAVPMLLSTICQAALQKDVAATLAGALAKVPR